MSIGEAAAKGPFGRIALLDIDRPVAAHAHPHCHVLIKIAGADSFFKVAGSLQPLKRDTAVTVNPWQPHGYPWNGAPGQRSLILALYIEADWLRTVDRLFAASPLFPAPCFAPSPQLRHLADETAEALAGNSGQLEILLASLMAEIVTETSGLRRLKGQAGSIADFRIRRAIHELRACAVQGTGFDARQLARTAGLSRSHLFEMFKRETGLTPSLLHNALRMETAYGRLHEHQTAIQDIASGLGFSKAGHFTRFFASNFGINPRSYRRLVAAK